MSKVRQPNHISAATGANSTPGHEELAFIATLRGTPGRDVLDTAIDALRNLHHGESSASGILTHIPHALLRQELGGDLPQAGRYAVGFIFHHEQSQEQDVITEVAAEEGFAVLSWRDVPVNDTIVDIEPRQSMPVMTQVILTPERSRSREEIDVGLYRLRRRVEAQTRTYFASLSRTTIVYKGLVPASRLAVFYADLADPNYRTEIAIVHSHRGQRFSAWQHAQPHRVLAHDGQIHSAAANKTWMQARMPQMTSACIEGVTQVIPTGHLIEGDLDEFVELLHRCGRSLTHSLRMVIPEQWGRHMTEAEQAFYDYAATVVEPWEGSGVTCFADGYLVGAVLDRHGSRSGRYWITETGLVVFASETGVVDLEPSTITKKGRLAPGELIAVDTVVGNVIPSDAVRAQLAGLHPYQEWLQNNLILSDSPELEQHKNQAETASTDSGINPAYQVSDASLSKIAGLVQGQTPDAIGNSSRNLTFFDRFRSQRSQLTSPHIDAIARPENSGVYLGPRDDILHDGPNHSRKFYLAGPAMNTPQFVQLQQHFITRVCSGVYQPKKETLQQALTRVEQEAAEAVATGAEILVVSNKGSNAKAFLPIPSLLLTAVVHQYLLKQGQRARVSIVVESGDAVEPIHVLRLVEAGAEAVFAFQGIAIVGQDSEDVYVNRVNEQAFYHLLQAGVSAYGSYQGGHQFHVVGLDDDLVDSLFPQAKRGLGTFGLSDIDDQLQNPEVLLEPVHELLHPRQPTAALRLEEALGISIDDYLLPTNILRVTNTRKYVQLGTLARAEHLVLEPPAHHDTTHPDGLGLLIQELKAINPQTRVHALIGADLTCEEAASRAVEAGADIINIVDGEYEWVLGLLALHNSPLLDHADLAVGTPLSSAREVFVAVALGAKLFRLHSEVDEEGLRQELERLLSCAGVKKIDDVVGRRDLLDWAPAVQHWKDAGVNLGAIRSVTPALDLTPPIQQVDSLGETLIDLTHDALNYRQPTRINAFVNNSDISVGTRLAGEIARRFGSAGLGQDTIRISLTGSAGPSLGAYAAPGMTLTVQGEAADFVGKGLAGGRIIVRPESSAGFFSQQNVIAGSAIGYGAREGGIYLAGEVGERLGAHNWGATIVAEGAGDAAGYRMHSGTLVILGDVGINLGAGMEGGVIYVLDFHPGNLYTHQAYGRLVASELEESDLRILTAVIAEHVEGTQSRIGTLLLAEPDQLFARFTKIHRAKN